jgi:hypothetical protein
MNLDLRIVWNEEMIHLTLFNLAVVYACRKVQKKKVGALQLYRT